MAHAPHREDIEKLLRLFDGESDRAVVVLGGAYLDACLEETLRTWLAGDVSEVFKMPGGLLSHYGAKYQLAYALGAISNDNRNEFKAIGVIRNHFAHHVLDATWDHPEVQKRMKLLRGAFRTSPNLKDRHAFLVFVGVLSGYLRLCEKEARAKMKAEALVKAMRAPKQKAKKAGKKQKS